MAYALEIQDVHKVFNRGTINEKVAFNDSGRHVNGPAHRWSKSVPGRAMTHKKYYQSDTA